MIRIVEIFESLQGESTFAGIPCFFIRLAGCNLRCTYCDTPYALNAETGNSRLVSITEILAELKSRDSVWKNQSLGNYRLPLVEVTGGEPMLQTDTPALLEQLCDAGYTVLLETNGSIDLRSVDFRVRKIVDVKVPSSGELRANLDGLTDTLLATDEVKFVIGCEEDYQWMCAFLKEHPQLPQRCTVLVSWYDQFGPMLRPVKACYHPISRAELAEAILRDGLPVRFQLQVHKILWPNADRGK